MKETQDDVTIVLAWATHGRETVNDGRLDLDQTLAARAQRGLIVDAGERERREVASKAAGEIEMRIN